MVQATITIKHANADVDRTKSHDIEDDIEKVSSYASVLPKLLLCAVFMTCSSLLIILNKVSSLIDLAYVGQAVGLRCG